MKAREALANQNLHDQRPALAARIHDLTFPKSAIQVLPATLDLFQP